MVKMEGCRAKSWLEGVRQGQHQHLVSGLSVSDMMSPGIRRSRDQKHRPALLVKLVTEIGWVRRGMV